MGKDVIIALDFDSKEKTLAFLDRFTGKKPFVKIGMELFYAEGPSIVREIKARGHQIFLDLKLHDIPNTVKKAMAVLSSLDVDMVNLHAAGTRAMMTAALEGLTRADGTRPLLIAVTQLTSTSQQSMEEEIGIHAPLADVVIDYAKNAQAAGLDGVVCSPLEAGKIHEACSGSFVTVTPGIRFADAKADDQVRITTPEKARAPSRRLPTPSQPTSAACRNSSDNRKEQTMESTARRIAEDLLSIRAVFFRPDEPFTWASGIKSPVYCDNRLILTAPDVRTEVETALMQTIRREYPDAEVLMGTSTAGIAHAAITAQMMGLPMGYVRSSSKDHGRQNQIEGRLEKGQKVVVVEDLISTGGSVLEVVNVLREAGAEVLGIVSIFTYGMKKGLERLAAAKVRNVSLTNFDVIAQVAAEQKYIKPEDVARLLQFRNDPSDESWIGGTN